jgi:hypothetical protein
MQSVQPVQNNEKKTKWSLMYFDEKTCFLGKETKKERLPVMKF